MKVSDSKNPQADTTSSQTVLFARDNVLSPTRTGSHSVYPEHIYRYDVVVEVGAKWGGGTVLISKIANSVYSFEPKDSNFKILRAFTRRIPNAKIFKIALSDHKGEEWLYYPDQKKSPGMDISGVGSLKTIEGYNYTKRQTVSVRSLDDI